MIMLSHGWRCYPTEENVYDFYSRGVIGVIVHGHVINIYITLIHERYLFIHLIIIELQSQVIIRDYDSK